MSVNRAPRVDLEVVANLIAPRAKVLDVGCGDGALLEYPADRQAGRRARHGTVAARRQRMRLARPVGDPGRRRPRPRLLPRQGLRLRRSCRRPCRRPATRRPCWTTCCGSASTPSSRFPISAIGGCAFRCCFKGRMPVTRDLPYSWYDTPNIHFCTIRDFVELCDEVGAQGRKRHRARRQRPEDRLLDALVVLELLRPAGGVPAEKMSAFGFRAKTPAPISDGCENAPASRWSIRHRC